MKTKKLSSRQLRQRILKLLENEMCNIAGLIDEAKDLDKEEFKYINQRYDSYKDFPEIKKLIEENCLIYKIK